MEVKNCVKCGRMFQWLSGDVICDNCKKKEEEDFQRVRTYIEEHPHATMNEITKECKVKMAKIQQWVREERLEFSKDSPIQLTCENCGETILTGRYCKKCKVELAKGLGASIARPAAPKPEHKKPTTGHAAMQFLKK